MAAEFHAYLRLDRQFVTMGDNVKIEAKTRDGSDKPFSAKGYVHFTRLIPAIPQVRVRDPETLKWKIIQPYVPPREEPDGSLFIQTDAANEGLGLAFWNPDKTGDYRIDYRAKDKYGNDIYASESISRCMVGTTTPACQRPTSALPCSRSGNCTRRETLPASS